MAANDKAGGSGRLLQQAVLRAKVLNERTHGWLGILSDAGRKTLSPNSTISAAAIGYFALFSLFPLTLLTISIASFTPGPEVDSLRVIRRLEFIAPALGRLLGPNIDGIVAARGPVTGLSLMFLVWSASTIFFTLSQSLREIWGVKLKRPVWKRRGLAILFVLVFVGPALFLASFAGSMIFNLGTWLPDPVVLVGSALSVFLAILLNIALFIVLYITLPHGDSTWRELLPGAIGAGLLWELAKKAFLFFVATYLSVSNLVYGSVAVIFAFLVWAYLSGLIFLFGAFLSVSFFHHKRKEIPQLG
jgi:membrane protein